LYGKLERVPQQFPEGTVNIVFVFHRSFNDRETLKQALFGWQEAYVQPAHPEPGAAAELGLFAQEAWQDVSGCSLCRVEESAVRFLKLWPNPHARVPIPPGIYGVLEGGAP
jgi:hypothetical protein